MPITQERMLALVSEGMELYRSLESLKSEIHTALHNSHDNPSMALMLIEGTLAVHRTPQVLNLIAEGTHLRLRAKANLKNRERMQRARGSNPNARNAPTSLVRALEPQDLEGLNLQAEFEKWNKGELD